MPRDVPLKLESLRAQLASQNGKQYWRTLEELADTEEFQEYLHREFPQQASEWNGGGTTRRDFLKLMGASLALAGLQGCGDEPEEKIVPYVESPEQIVPGKPLFFATAMEVDGIATGVLVENHMGRPTKVEGNPLHPASLGSTDRFSQASVLGLYDPDRSQVVTHQDEISTWGAFLDAITRELNIQGPKQGAGLRILSESITSPTLVGQKQTLLEKFPQARWDEYDPVVKDNSRAGAQLAFGEFVEPLYQFDRADVILSLDADFLDCLPSQLRYIHDFAERRRVVGDEENSQAEMNRLYVVESTPTLTGASADHRLRMRPSQIEAVARAIASKLGIEVSPPGEEELQGIPRDWLETVANDLRNYRLEDGMGASLVLAGERQPPAVHALAHAMNDKLGNVGETVSYIPPLTDEQGDQIKSLERLTKEMRAGEVETLVILGGNPVLTAPVDLKFADALAEVPFRAHMSLYEDETSALCDWHLPQAHYLESWGDTRTFNGTASIIQPLIAPLYDGRTLYDLMTLMFGEPGKTAYEIVREHWQNQYGNQQPQQGQAEQKEGTQQQEGGQQEQERQKAEEDSFEDFWQRILHDGVIPETRFSPRELSLKENFLQELPLPSQPDQQSEDSMEVVFWPDPHIWDGDFANNAWLQELPKPLSKLTWDNAAFISLGTAERLELVSEEMVELEYQGRRLQIPVWVLPGHPDGVVTLHFGYGRTQAGQVGNETGFNVYQLRTSAAPWFGSGVELRKTDERYPLASTQHHHLLEGRDLLRSGTLTELKQDPEDVEFLKPEEHSEEEEQPSLYPEYEYEGYQWGMVIDQTTCIGCNACVVACQSENNIPVVGKPQVRMNREMHWLRIDSYYKGDLENPETYFQPMLCQHCEKAPCEVVCPVVATTHSDSGINEMTYNRCVGTRYCSNNCPYKVRRFNFLSYTDYEEQPTLKMLQNPDVTVRSRGVMEKCTYCIQRINETRIEAEKEGRLIRTGEVETACQSACPTNAIVFGNINNSESPVPSLKENPLNYSVLGELNTQPRTTYLAAIRNPNPEL